MGPSFLLPGPTAQIPSLNDPAPMHFRVSPVVFDGGGIYEVWFGMDCPLRKVDTFKVVLRGLHRD